MIKKILMAAVLVLIAIQFVPVEKTNPPVESEVPAPAEVKDIFERSCFDCHSHETKWPWYSHVAPVSWLVAFDVKEGRRHVNLSAWEKIPQDYRKITAHEMAEEVAEHEMPLWYYTLMHPKARLSDQDIATLQAWAKSQGSVEESEYHGEHHHQHDTAQASL